MTEINMITRLKNIKYPAFWITVAVFVALEIFMRAIPAEYASSVDVFVTNHRKRLAEAALPEFDYIILGDSRSISLMGHAPLSDEPYSIYNFSLPALGPRYFRHFLDKYLRNRRSPPAAVIFAGEPQHFVKNASHPHHDPDLLYSEGPDDNLGRYLTMRVVRRVQYALQGGAPQSPYTTQRELLWPSYSHRYLHLFDLDELAEQYTGAERIFILREAAPLLIRSYKFRDAVRLYTLGFRFSLFQDNVVPPAGCDTCAGTTRVECYPEMSLVQENRLVAKGLRERYGQMNITNRLHPMQRAAVLMVRDTTIKQAEEHLNVIEPDLTQLELLMSHVSKKGIKLVLLELPILDTFQNVKFYRLYNERVAELVKKYPLVARIPFPEPLYPRELYSEHTHYECLGSERLNRDFYRAVVPEILKFAPPDASPERARTRGF